MDELFRISYPVAAADYSDAGKASTDIKRKLKQLGVGGDVLRRVAVASYEVELNLVIHSLGGELTLTVFPDAVRLVSSDVGPGIPDLEMAMREGFSTANEEARSMGFGAGMGLSNSKRVADSFDIKSSVPTGTTVVCGFDLAKGK